MNIFTAKCGTLTPMLCDEIVAGSVIDLNLALSASLPPLASDSFLRASWKVEAFFVPMRLLYKGFEHFFVGDEFEVWYDDNYQTVSVPALPHFAFVSGTVTAGGVSGFAKYFGPGSLADYLGFKSDSLSLGSTISPSDARSFNILPWLCYHKCWDDWYRASAIQKSCFAPVSDYNSGAMPSVGVLPYAIYEDSLGLTLVRIDAASSVPFLANEFRLADDTFVFDLRQRNFGFDYFTTALPTPNVAEQSRVTLDANNLANGFTISQLRTINSLTQFKERNQLAGDRYVDRLFAQYGCRPSDGIAQRSLCIGTADFEVYNKGIYQNANNGQSNNNPFAGQVGAKYGSASASSGGSVHLVDSFRAAEPGYLMVIGSLVPRVTYAYGVNPMLYRYTESNSIGEMANPILQNIGPEPIYTRELCGDVFGGTDIFGYQDRYGSFKNRFDELHGLVRAGQSLASFALQRALDNSQDPRINSEFLEIPTDYMDGVTVVDEAISDYGCWVDSFFDYKVSMPLAKYALPSLENPAYEHGKTITIRRGGFRF